MKRTIVIIALLFSIFSAYAQSGSNSWGIKAAFDINIPSKLGGRINGEKLDLFRIGYGGTIGAVYSHWFNDAIYIEPGASLFYDSYSYKDLIIINETGFEAEKDPSLYKLGVRIPLVVGYSYYLLDTLPMRFYTGPEVSYSFAGQVRIKNKSLAGDISTDVFGKNGFMHPFDCAWKIGLGVDTEFATICFEAAIGLTDIYKDNLTLRDNRVAISLTRYF